MPTKESPAWACLRAVPAGPDGRREAVAVGVAGGRWMSRTASGSNGLLP
ncbi:MAG: hypothetical protein OJF60_001691 [Burkholderiaceae bacterium]|nr:MAG: hypothetical protein OJF60_001691 [Burkholderiaceae bacterium]